MKADVKVQSEVKLQPEVQTQPYVKAQLELEVLQVWKVANRETTVCKELATKVVTYLAGVK